MDRELGGGCVGGRKGGVGGGWVDAWMQAGEGVGGLGRMDAWRHESNGVLLIVETGEAAGVAQCRNRRGVREVSLYDLFSCAVCFVNINNVVEMLVDKPCNTHVHTLLKTHGLGLPWWSRGWGNRLPMQRTRVRSLTREDPTCRGAPKPVAMNLRGRAQTLPGKPVVPGARARERSSPCSPQRKESLRTAPAPCS